MKTLTFVFSVLVLFSMQARADDACKNPKTPYDSTYCTAKLFLESDKELNKVYKELKDSLKKEQKDKLTKSQRKWIEFRDATCSKDGTINVDCNFQVNKARGEQLRDRLRECKTGHCDEALLFAEDFKAPSGA